jgi:hypothetical protein
MALGVAAKRFRNVSTPAAGAFDRFIGWVFAITPTHQIGHN